MAAKGAPTCLRASTATPLCHRPRNRRSCKMNNFSSWGHSPSVWSYLFSSPHSFCTAASFFHVPTLRTHARYRLPRLIVCASWRSSFFSWIYISIHSISLFFSSLVACALACEAQRVSQAAASASSLLQRAKVLYPVWRRSHLPTPTHSALRGAGEAVPVGKC